jgi:hypothetical protein
MASGIGISAFSRVCSRYLHPTEDSKAPFREVADFQEFEGVGTTIVDGHTLADLRQRSTFSKKSAWSQHGTMICFYQ